MTGCLVDHPAAINSTNLAADYKVVCDYTTIYAVKVAELPSGISGMAPLISDINSSIVQ